MFNQYSKAKCYLFDRTDTNAHSYVRHANSPSAYSGQEVQSKPFCLVLIIYTVLQFTVFYHLIVV